jgi:nicotinamidase-related amidase
MTAQLLIIDPQNDFCDIPGAALPVAGADADMRRLGALIDAAGKKLQDIVVTMDSHPQVAIERPGFWKKRDGTPVTPFTEITAAQVRAGDYATIDPALADEALAYLDALEAGNRYKLMVWTTHCVEGTWGHEMHEAIAGAVARWEAQATRSAGIVRKGMNPMTEQYSAVRAEVPREDDTNTATNTALVQRAATFDGFTFIAGEAASHCVAATARDLFAGMTAEKLAQTILLSDCMSPVTGFEAVPAEFFGAAAKLGVRSMTAAEALALLGK